MRLALTRRGSASRLDADTVALLADGSTGEAEVSQVIPRSRVAIGADPAALEEERAWLAGGRLPDLTSLGPSRLVSDALLDLHALTRPYGVTVAGWAPDWRYVWPRDVAFATSAFARTGHAAEAIAILDFLQSRQPENGQFEARYRPDSSGPPDQRERQLDGLGWALWALDETVTSAGLDPTPYRALLDRSFAAILISTASGRNFPAPSPDYWEVPERRVTLATCALLLTGLQCAERLYARLDDPRTAVARDAAERFRARVLRGFAPNFPRRLGGLASSVDLGVALALRPFAGVDDPLLRAAWSRAPRYLSRPAGGFAPGGSWRRDGISWTPAVATYALVAAAEGRSGTALQGLRWLDAHRTAAGSLPEKVLPNGAPASVAPLAWTAAAVVITADLLRRR